MEIYLNVKPTIFAELVGFGPANNEKFSSKLGFSPRQNHHPALVAQLTTGEVFTCKFNSDNQQSLSSILSERNFILPEDFAAVGMDEKIKLLIEERIAIDLTLGDSWEIERFLTWEQVDEYILSQIPIDTALSLGDGYKIARRLELIYEYELFNAICEATILASAKDKAYQNWQSGRDEVTSIVANGLPWLINFETHRVFGKSSKKPGLDYYDNVK